VVFERWSFISSWDIKLNFTLFFRFKAKAMHISGLLKDRRRTPLQETCDWIEYVLRHGGARHLRPQVFNIPWYQYYLLDVMAFIVVMVILVVVVIIFTGRFLCCLCCRKSESKTKKEWNKQTNKQNIGDPVLLHIDWQTYSIFYFRISGVFSGPGVY